jgi:hypothetical protein
MAVKILKTSDETYIFDCPGCGMSHGFNKTWQFDGNFESPTVSPSLLTRIPNHKGKPDYKCHLFIKDGKLDFLNDCDHELAGQRVDMEDMES